MNCCDFPNASDEVVFKEVLSGRERLETPRALFADGVSKLSTNEFTSAYEETPGVVLHVPFSPATFAAVNGSIELTEVGMGRVSEFKAAISSTFSDGRWPPTLTDLLGFILFDRRLRHFHGRRTRSQNLLVLTDALNARSRGDLALLLAPGISTSRHCWVIDGDTGRSSVSVRFELSEWLSSSSVSVSFLDVPLEIPVFMEGTRISDMETPKQQASKALYKRICEVVRWYVIK
jgi:hypothetical protein